jgi:hypothetical protein
VENRVEEAGIDVHLFDRRRQPIEELPLRVEPDHPVPAGAEDQRRRVNRGRVLDDPPRRVVQIEQHVDGDLPEDQRILRVTLGLGRVVRQQPRLHVALDVAVAEQRLPEAQQRHRARHVQLHA